MRAVKNQLDNAFKYSGDHTRIRCGVVRQGRHWRLYVQDEGRGLSPTHAELIFRPFVRVNTEDGHTPWGAGLGLAFVKTVVERHRGTISVNSREREGSTFSIDLPALDDAATDP